MELSLHLNLIFLYIYYFKMQERINNKNIYKRRISDICFNLFLEEIRDQYNMYENIETQVRYKNEQKTKHIIIQLHIAYINYRDLIECSLMTFIAIFMYMEEEQY